jgi:hypothetical protein
MTLYAIEDAAQTATDATVDVKVWDADLETLTNIGGVRFIKVKVHLPSGIMPKYQVTYDGRTGHAESHLSTAIAVALPESMTYMGHKWR